MPSETPSPHDDPDVALFLRAGTDAPDAEAAFSELVGKYQGALLNFFIRMGASSDGEDLVQETFVRLFRYRRQYKPAARFTTFLYHLARNVWADRGRKIVRIERLASEFQKQIEIAHQPSPEPSAHPGDLEGALERLSPKLREVIVLNIFQGLKYQEVADALEIPLGTVKSRINLALAALKEILHEKP